MQHKNKHYNIKYFKDRDSLCGYIAQPILLLAKEKKCKKALDVGAGTGRLVNYLNNNGINTIGIDKSTIASKYKGVRKGVASKLTYNKNTFDLLTSISVIEHLNEKDGIKFLK